ncbi:MAG: ComEC/Rec2 family competence protein [Propionibacteriaceae bacterium]|nr:ComEC/Rec2 family competence protein [Propionibacteriaceae bacterium]
MALVGLVLVVTAAVGGLRLAVLTSGPVPELARDQAVAAVELSVESVRLVGQPITAVVSATLTRAEARGQSHAARVGVLVFAPGERAGDWAQIIPGSTVALTARLAAAERTDAAAAVLRPLSQPVVTTPAGGWRAGVEHVRQALRQAVAGARPEAAALLPALVVGDTSTMPASLTEDFRTTGLTHLTAVSGANLTILLACLLAVARAVKVTGRALNLVAVVGVAGFVALCHSEPSVLRAAAMGLVGLAAVGRSARPGQGARHLAQAVVALVWIDPWLSHSYGFALSVLACVGLLLWAGPWTASLNRWLPHWAAEAIAVPLAAQLATQPVVAQLSGAVSLVGLAANALAAPLVAPATVAGLVTAVVATVHAGLGRLVGTVAAWTVEPILQIGHRAASLPGAAQPWPATAVGLTLLTVGCLFAAWLMPRLLRRRLVVLALGLAMVVGGLRGPAQPGWPPADWRAVACDVGQGDALAVRVADGQALLLDLGPADAGLPACLRSLDIDRVPLVVLSHLHADHVGGLAELLDGWEVGAMLVSDAALAAAAPLEPARRAGVALRVAGANETFQVGAARVEVLSPARPVGLPATAGDVESSAENDNSLVVRVTVDGFSLLATGDLETAGQQALVSSHLDLAADVLKVPHHGSARQDEAFLAAVGARVALISVGANNSYGHPAASTLRRLEALGMTLARTDRDGAVALSWDQGQLEITSQR